MKGKKYIKRTLITLVYKAQDTNLGSNVQGRGMSKQNGCPAITRWRKFEVALKSKVIFLHRLFLSSSVIDQYKHTCDTLKTARYLITNTQIHHVCIKLLKVIPTDTEHVFLKKHLPEGRATNTHDARKTGKLKPTFKWIAFRERKLLGLIVKTRKTTRVYVIIRKRRGKKRKIIVQNCIENLFAENAI